jgi:hypothetical protein
MQLKKTLTNKKEGMSWLIKTEEDKFEIWTDQEYTMRKQKCEYYGSEPLWVEVRQLESSISRNAYEKPVISTNLLIKDLILSR